MKPITPLMLKALLETAKRRPSWEDCTLYQFHGGTTAALRRRGLIEAVWMDDDRWEWRLTDKGWAAVEAVTTAHEVLGLHWDGTRRDA